MLSSDFPHLTFKAPTIEENLLGATLGASNGTINKRMLQSLAMSKGMMPSPGRSSKEPSLELKRPGFLRGELLMVSAKSFLDSSSPLHVCPYVASKQKDIKGLVPLKQRCLCCFALLRFRSLSFWVILLVSTGLLRGNSSEWQAAQSLS